MKLLNIGCGSVFHSAWTNIDLESASPDVRSYDISKGLPYPNAHFDGCYSSHVIEHFTQSEAKQLLSECFRVLKSQGVVRVVVPDLESIAINYLSALEQVENGGVEAEPNYDWMVLELYDQTVRGCTGGQMGHYLSKDDLKNKDFVLSRIGFEAENFWASNKETKNRSYIEKIKSKRISWLINKLKIYLAKYLVLMMAGKEAKAAFDEGLFRSSGEIHRWMYDRYSLRRLLEQSGFVDVRICSAEESRIAEFNSYSLDTTKGKVRKPDSIFMEGLKP